MDADLDLALRLVDRADEATVAGWSPNGVVSRAKQDGSPVTAADVAAERSMLAEVRRRHPADGFVGEEVGEHGGSSGRRWIADGIDGTRFFAAGDRTWGTLLALEADGEIVLGVCSSPLLKRRWWAARGLGAHAGPPDGSDWVRVRVSDRTDAAPERVACLPRHDSLSPTQQQSVEEIAGGVPLDRPWSHQIAVAQGSLDACVWYGGAIWDHAAPSILVEEAGGRFTDHAGGHRLDTRTAVYSNAQRHDDILTTLAAAAGAD